MTTAWATQRINGVSNHISAHYQTSELTHQLQRVKCKALFTCLPLLGRALQSAAEAGIPKEHVFLLELPSKTANGAAPAPVDVLTIDQLIDEGSKLDPLEPLAWTEGQGARQTAFLCCSSGTSGMPVSPASRLMHSKDQLCFQSTHASSSRKTPRSPTETQSPSSCRQRSMIVLTSHQSQKWPSAYSP